MSSTSRTWRKSLAPRYTQTEPAANSTEDVYGSAVNLANLFPFSMPLKICPFRSNNTPFSIESAHQVDTESLPYVLHFAYLVQVARATIHLLDLSNSQRARREESVAQLVHALNSVNSAQSDETDMKTHYGEFGCACSLACAQDLVFLVRRRNQRWHNRDSNSRP